MFFLFAKLLVMGSVGRLTVLTEKILVNRLVVRRKITIRFFWAVRAQRRGFAYVNNVALLDRREVMHERLYVRLTVRPR